MRDRIRGAIFGARKGIGLGEACFVRWAIMNIMAIEDGLFPLAYVTHTIKYLQQCKFSRSIKTRANNWLNYVSSSLNSCGGERRWQSKCLCISIRLSVRPAGRRGRVNSVSCYMNGGSLLWHGGSNERKHKEGREERTNQHSAPRGSAGCRHRFYCYLLRRQGRAQ